LITGTPGIGKTAVSEQLAAKLDALHIDLADLVKRERLTIGYDKRRQTLVADELKLKRRVQQIVEQHEGDVIIDGHYAPAIILKTWVTKVFVLRCHPWQLRQQMEERGFKDNKLWENLAVEILDICLYDAIKACGEERVCEVNVTGKNSEEVANDVLAILKGTKPCVIKTIDWLGQLEKEKQLNSYLRWQPYGLR